MISLYKEDSYCIIAAGSLAELADSVQGMIDEGWKCSGGVAPGVDNSQGVFTQAMIL